MRPGAVDAAHLARLVNIAGDAMPLAHWRTLGGPQDDPWAIGAERAARDTGGFSWRNATMAEIDGQVAAAMIAYRIDSKQAPKTMPTCRRISLPCRNWRTRRSAATT